MKRIALILTLALLTAEDREIMARAQAESDAAERRAKEEDWK